MNKIKSIKVPQNDYIQDVKVNQPMKVSLGGEVNIGHGLKYDINGSIAVNIVNNIEQDNTLPITSAAVYTEIGNIDALLTSI